MFITVREITLFPIIYLKAQINAKREIPPEDESVARKKKDSGSFFSPDNFFASFR